MEENVNEVTSFLKLGYLNKLVFSTFHTVYLFRSRSPVHIKSEGERDRDRKRSRSRSPRRPRNMTTKRCIISNIPYDLKWQEIKDLFRNEGICFCQSFNSSVPKHEPWSPSFMQKVVT